MNRRRWIWTWLPRRWRSTTFTAQFGAAKLAGNIAGSKLIDAPALSGSFELAELAPRELMAQFGITPPVTRDDTRAGALWREGQLRLAGQCGAPDRPVAGAG